MKTKPRISVIIPAYNHERYLADAIDSVLDQTLQDFEIILLNDGSVDSTGDICESYAKLNYRICYMHHRNIGAHATINKGISEANGEYIAVLNSDDIFKTNKLERCIEIVEQNPNTELISGKVGFIDSDGKAISDGVSINWQMRGLSFLEKTKSLPLSILNENFIATTSNMFFTQLIWERVGGFQNLRYCHDLDFLMACFRSGSFVYDQDTIHIEYRVHQSNTIKENIDRIRVEIAAVIATSIVDYNTKLLPDIGIDGCEPFFEFLKIKDLSDYTIYLIMNYLHMKDRSALYSFLQSRKVLDKIL